MLKFFRDFWPLFLGVFAGSFFGYYLGNILCYYGPIVCRF